MNSVGKGSTRRLFHHHVAHADEHANSSEGLSDISPLSCQSYRVVIDTALSMLQEVGYRQLTIEGVAAAAGVDTAAIYWRWATKAGLVIEAMSHRRQAPSMCGDPEKDIRAMVLNLIEIFNDAVPCALPAFTGNSANDPGVAEELATVLSAYCPEQRRSAARSRQVVRTALRHRHHRWTRCHRWNHLLPTTDASPSRRHPRGATH